MANNSKGGAFEEVEFLPSKNRMITGRRDDKELRNMDRDGLRGCRSNRMICAVSSGVVILIVIIISVLLGSSAHKIMQGTVGVYFVGGALKDKVTQPGIHFCMPFITDIERIQIRPRTDTLPPITTVTKDGIQNKFHDVQVISDVKSSTVVPLIKKYGMEFHETLVYDRIYEEIRIFCAGHTIDEVYNTMFLDIVETVRRNVEQTIKELGENGITIYHLTIPKPDIPPDIAANYKEVKVQWTQQLVAIQQQKTEKIKKDTETIKAVADAERQKQVLEIDIQKDILQKEGEKTLSTLENEILKDRKKSAADVENYAKTQLAQANERLFNNTGYIQLEMAKALSQNTKFFFSGESSPLGAVLAKIMGQT
jgi:regulator of protease activity HflC (stomatin/prohibitin superfamily)